MFFKATQLVVFFCYSSASKLRHLPFFNNSDLKPLGEQSKVGFPGSHGALGGVSDPSQDEEAPHMAMGQGEVSKVSEKRLHAWVSLAWEVIA